LLQIVYGFRPELNYPPQMRVEFSIHPLRRGYRHEHTIIWEMEEFDQLNLTSDICWPNHFSRMIGDKAFGLLIAYLLDLPVPHTTVISRHIAPFHFGENTDTGDVWIRTCPREPQPGRFATKYGWCDPFSLMSSEDPEGIWISSILAQQGVDPIFSGAAVVNESGHKNHRGHSRSWG
jgi:hypothetical protein